MVNLGVVNLFPKVSTDEGLLAVQDELESNFFLGKFTRIPIDNLEIFPLQTTFPVRFQDIPTRRFNYVIAIISTNSKLIH